MSEQRTPPTGAIRQAWIDAHPFRASTPNEERDAEFDRWLAAHDAELRAEVERLRERESALIRAKDADLDDLRDEVEGRDRLVTDIAQEALTAERERDEARQQVADLRARIEALLPGETVNVYAGGGNLVSQRRVVDPDHLRTLLAGSGEQPGEGRGPVRDGWCCWTCADLAAAAGPAPMVPDSAGLREAVERVTAYLDEMDRVDAANRAGSRYDDTVHGINDLNLRRSDLRAVLAAVGQGVTAEQAWDEGFADGYRQRAEGEDGPRFTNPYRAAVRPSEKEGS